MKLTGFRSILTVTAGIAVAAAATTKTCITATKTANYDNLPTGALTAYEGLHYEGFEVVKTSKTPWSSDKSKNVLRMTNDQGVIRTANSHHLYNDKLFVFGCASRNATTAEYCGVHKLYGVPCNYFGCTAPGPAFDFPFDVDNNPHSLEDAEGDEPSNAPNVTWSIYDTYGNPFKPGTAPQLYLDNYVYDLITCN